MCFLLYACSAVGIYMQISAGISFPIIDDILIFILASILLYFTIRKRSSVNKLIGILSLVTTIAGFPLRVLSGPSNSKSKDMGGVIAITAVKTFLLIFCAKMSFSN